jgi:hypothetical protein
MDSTVHVDNEKSPCLQLIRGLAMLNSSSGAVSLRTENSSGSGTFSSEQFFLLQSRVTFCSR